MPISVVINSLYRQIIFTNGISFSLTLPSIPKTADEFSESDLNAKLEHSYAQSIRGEGKPYEEVFDALEKDIK